MSRNNEEFEMEDASQNWFRFQRTYPDSLHTLSPRARINAMKYRKQLESLFDKGEIRISPAEFKTANWNSIGPLAVDSYVKSISPSTGRVTAIAVSPADPQSILVGGAAGGIWLSTNGGTSFCPVSDDQVDYAVASIAFAKSDPSIVYAAMGDNVGGYTGEGVLKSLDGGRYWKKIESDSLPIGAGLNVLVDPTDPDRVYLTQYRYCLHGTGYVFCGGFLSSTDGGVSWKQFKTGYTRDLVMHPKDPTILYLAMTDADPSTGPTAAVFKSTDSGKNWKPIYVPLSGGILNLNVGVTTAEPDTVYVLSTSSSKSGPKAILLLSQDGGYHWDSPAEIRIDITGSSYLEVDPNDARIIFIGTRDLFKSTDRGITWTNLTQNWQLGKTGWEYNPVSATSHSDQHSFAFSPDNSNIVYIGNDGGLSRSMKGGYSFHSLNETLSLVQLNSITSHPNQPITYGGTQDNGAVILRDRSKGLEWEEFISGDSGGCVLDPNNLSDVLTNYVFGIINVSFDNGGKGDENLTTNATFKEPDSSPRIAFCPPFTSDPRTRSLYLGTWRLYRSTDQGRTWKLVDKTDLTAGKTNDFEDVLTVIAISHTDSGVIYTGSANGRAMVTPDGGKTWRDISKGLPNRCIKSIVVSHDDSKTAYLTVSGVNSGHVFKTVDAGKTWFDISGNLRNISQIPVNALLIDPVDQRTLYIGTDIGVFISTNDGVAWNSLNQGLPTVIVTGFATSNNGKVQIATYGRGAYELTT